LNSFSHPFIVLKLKTGETLFAELIEQLEESYVVRNPRQTKMFFDDSGKEGLILDHWIPYTNDEIFELNEDIVYYVGELSETYVKFYGACLLREELAKIHLEGNHRVKEGEAGFSVYKEVMAQIKELGEDYSIKFGLSPTSHMISDEDLSEDRILN
jgi:hypothetical protein